MSATDAAVEGNEVARCRAAVAEARRVAAAAARVAEEGPGAFVAEEVSLLLRERLGGGPAAGTHAAAGRGASHGVGGLSPG
jgi:hypothetical protein